MTYTYTWANEEQTSLKRTDAEGNVAFVPVAEGNRDYAEFLSTGATASAYVEPPAPEPAPEPEQQTTEEKIARLLSDYNLTKNELKVFLSYV